MKNTTLSSYVPNQNALEQRFSITRFTKRLFVDIICFLLILLFVYAAMSKLLDYQKFTIQISKSPVLHNFSGVFAWAIPGLEIVISVLIIFPKYRLIGLYAGLCLMLLFTFYIIDITQFNNGDIPCSCGGILQNMSWGQHLVFNIIFSTLATIGILLYQPLPRTDK